MTYKLKKKFEIRNKKYKLEVKNIIKLNELKVIIKAYA